MYYGKQCVDGFVACASDSKLAWCLILILSKYFISTGRFWWVSDAGAVVLQKFCTFCY